MNFEELQQKIINCRKCPRLVAWREEVARKKVKRFRNFDYWGKAVPSFGSPEAELWIIGLAPAAHGANRTGRMFTGDRSGDWLYEALYNFGFASQKEALHRNDGQKLFNCYISAVVRCAPPKNKPTAQETHNCSEFLQAEYELLTNVKVFLALGQFAWKNVIKLLQKNDNFPQEKVPKFSHNLKLQLNKQQCLIASYHPSQQNTFTKKLTKEMWYEVFTEIRNIISS